MDQKNTIVNCYANPNCLFNHNGVCDNYVISIGEDGKCDCYVETEEKETSFADQYSFVEIKGYKQGQPVTLKIAEFNKPNKNKSIIKKDLFDEPFDEEYEALFKPNKNKSAIKDVVPECDLPVCDWSCKHALRSGPSFNPDLWCNKMKGKPAVGLFCSDYEED